MFVKNGIRTGSDAPKSLVYLVTRERLVGSAFEVSRLRKTRNVTEFRFSSSGFRVGDWRNSTSDNTGEAGRTLFQIPGNSQAKKQSANNEQQSANPLVERKSVQSRRVENWTLVGAHRNERLVS